MKKLAILAVLAAGSLPLTAQNSTVEEKVKYSSDKQTEETSMGHRTKRILRVGKKRCQTY